MALPEFALLVLVLQTACSADSQPPERTNIDDSKTFRVFKNNRRLGDQPSRRENTSSTSPGGFEPSIERYVTGRSTLPFDSDRVRRRVADNATSTAAATTTTTTTGNLPFTGSPRQSRAEKAADGRAQSYLDEVDDKDGDDGEKHGGGGHGGGHNKKKKKKKKKHGHGLFSFMKKMKKHMPSIMKKMHGPSMFMMGMAHANFHNFVMHALMMSKMALTTVVMMIVREMVFGDKDRPVKYYNFGYDPHHAARRRYAAPYDYPYDYKRRRRR